MQITLFLPSARSPFQTGKVKKSRTSEARIPGLLCIDCVVEAMKSQVLGWWWTNKKVLNSHDGPEPPSSFNQTEDIDIKAALSVVSNIKKEILNLKCKFVSEDGTSVDYVKMSHSEDMNHYVSSTHQLRQLNVSELTVSERKSLFINVYNALVVHALARNKLSPQSSVSTLDRLKFFAKYSYVIGGHAFCLNDIENGVLRGNRVSPVPLISRPFSASDPRLAVSLTCDPRIHFALNCGAKSCPPIAVYSPEEAVLNSQLQMATESFLDSTVSFHEKEKSVHLSKLFEWYRVDFGSTDTEVVSWIRDNGGEALRNKVDLFLNAHNNKVVLRYDEYDWALNN